jgi:hypothetical protein
VSKIVETAVEGPTGGHPGTKVASASIPAIRPSSATAASAAATAMHQRPLRDSLAASFQCRDTEAEAVSIDKKKVLWLEGLDLQGKL